jgi:hypothetical protein
MKNLMILAIALSSFSAFADCSIFVAKEGVTFKQEKILVKGLVKKGYNIVEKSEDSQLKLALYSGPRNRFNSMWYVSGILSEKQESVHYEGSDYAVMLPGHLLTMGISTVIPTVGTIAMKNFVSKLPACGKVAAEEEAQANDE